MKKERFGFALRVLAALACMFGAYFLVVTTHVGYHTPVVASQIIYILINIACVILIFYRRFSIRKLTGYLVALAPQIVYLTVEPSYHTGSWRGDWFTLVFCAIASLALVCVLRRWRGTWAAFSTLALLFLASSCLIFLYVPILCNETIYKDTFLIYQYYKAPLPHTLFDEPLKSAGVSGVAMLWEILIIITNLAAASMAFGNSSDCERKKGSAYLWIFPAISWLVIYNNLLSCTNIVVIMVVIFMPLINVKLNADQRKRYLFISLFVIELICLFHLNIWGYAQLKLMVLLSFVMLVCAVLPDWKWERFIYKNNNDLSYMDSPNPSTKEMNNPLKPWANQWKKEVTIYILKSLGVFACLGLSLSLLMWCYKYHNLPANIIIDIYVFINILSLVLVLYRKINFYQIIGYLVGLYPQILYLYMIPRLYTGSGSGSLFMLVYIALANLVLVYIIGRWQAHWILFSIFMLFTIVSSTIVFLYIPSAVDTGGLIGGALIYQYYNAPISDDPAIQSLKTSSDIYILITLEIIWIISKLLLASIVFGTGSKQIRQSSNTIWIYTFINILLLWKLDPIINLIIIIFLIIHYKIDALTRKKFIFIILMEYEIFITMIFIIFGGAGWYFAVYVDFAIFGFVMISGWELRKPKYSEKIEITNT